MTWVAALRAAPWVLAALAVIWAGFERNGRKDAEQAIVEQQNKSLEDANKAWGRFQQAGEAFDARVVEGLDKLQQKQRDIEATADVYRRAVAADPGGKVNLTPAELAALRLLVGQTGASSNAGGASLRPANQPAGVRR